MMSDQLFTGLGPHDYILYAHLSVPVGTIYSDYQLSPHGIIFDGVSYLNQPAVFFLSRVFSGHTHTFPFGGGFIFFYFHPYLGKWSNLTNIFQMGRNHQLVLQLEHDNITNKKTAV